MEIRTSRLLVTAGILVLCCMPEICRCGDPAAFMQSDEPPIVPVGLDAYRMWDKLPSHRIGVRAYMRSTYDREGNNRSADASHYLYQQSDEFNVALDVEGPGVLYFKRTNHWHGSPWHYEVDGEDYWGGRNMTLPFAGHPVGTAKKDAKNEKDLINSAYRFLIADIFPFGNRAVIGLEHGGTNESAEHYSGVAYWYGIDSPSLVLTDHFHCCDEKIEIREHEYKSPTAGEPYALVSRYEWGPDSRGARMHFPAEQDYVRTMKGTSAKRSIPSSRAIDAGAKRNFSFRVN